MSEEISPHLFEDSPGSRSSIGSFMFYCVLFTHSQKPQSNKTVSKRSVSTATVSPKIQFTNLVVNASGIKTEDCLDVFGEGFQQFCVNANLHSAEDCEHYINNGKWSVCQSLKNYTECQGSDYKYSTADYFRHPAFFGSLGLLGGLILSVIIMTIVLWICSLCCPKNVTRKKKSKGVESGEGSKPSGSGTKNSSDDQEPMGIKKLEGDQWKTVREGGEFNDLQKGQKEGQGPERKYRDGEGPAPPPAGDNYKTVMPGVDFNNLHKGQKDAQGPARKYKEGEGPPPGDNYKTVMPGVDFNNLQKGQKEGAGPERKYKAGVGPAPAPAPAGDNYKTVMPGVDFNNLHKGQQDPQGPARKYKEGRGPDPGDNLKTVMPGEHFNNPPEAMKEPKKKAPAPRNDFETVKPGEAFHNPPQPAKDPPKKEAAPAKKVDGLNTVRKDEHKFNNPPEPKKDNKKK